MKRNSTILLSAMAFGASALVAFAQDAGKPPGEPGGPGGSPGPGGPGGGGPGGPGGRGAGRMALLMGALDTNHDGTLDAAEIAKAPASLKTLDKNNDGKLTMDEIMPPRGGGGGQGGGQGGGPQGGPGGGGPGGPGGRPAPPIIAALDANHDGVIDASEMANASAALKTLDKNGDGQLTMDEIRPPRGQGGGGRPPQAPSGNKPDATTPPAQ